MNISKIVPDMGTATKIQQKKTSFFGDVLKLVSGTIFAQLLIIASSPILTRFYGPESFGILVLFTSITNIAVVIACMRYELAIMLPESDKEAANLLGVSIFFAILVSSLIAVGITWGREQLLRWLNAPELGPYLWLIAPMVVFSGIFIALNYWNSRTKRFGRLSIAGIISSAATTSTQIGFGFSGVANGGIMISATVGGKLLSMLVLGGQIWRDDGRLLVRSIHLLGMLDGIKRHYKFPLYSIWSGLLNTISWQLPAFLLSTFFSTSVVGYYAIGFRILQLPMSLVGQAIGQVFFQRAAQAKIQGNLAVVVEGVFRYLVVIGLFPILMLTIIGPNLFLNVFGAKWIDAGIYAQILAPFMFFNFIASPLGQIFSVLEKQEVGLITNIVLFLSRLATLIWGGLTGNILFTLALFSISGVIVYGGYSIWIINAAGVPVKKWMEIIVYSFARSAFFLAPAWLVCTFFKLQYWSLIMVYFVAFIGYYCYITACEPSTRSLLLKYFANFSQAQKQA